MEAEKVDRLFMTGLIVMVLGLFVLCTSLHSSNYKIEHFMFQIGMSCLVTAIALLIASVIISIKYFVNEKDD